MKKGETHYKEMPLGYADAPSKSFKSGDKKPAEQDQRMDMLEQKIHQLGQMLHEMRQERNRAEDNGSDKTPAPGNRTF